MSCEERPRAARLSEGRRHRRLPGSGDVWQSRTVSRYCASSATGLVFPVGRQFSFAMAAVTVIARGIGTLGVGHGDERLDEGRDNNVRVGADGGSPALLGRRRPEGPLA